MIITDILPRATCEDYKSRTSKRINSPEYKAKEEVYAKMPKVYFLMSLVWKTIEQDTHPVTIISHWPCIDIKKVTDMIAVTHTSTGTKRTETMTNGKRATPLSMWWWGMMPNDSTRIGSGTMKRGPDQSSRLYYYRSTRTTKALLVSAFCYSLEFHVVVTTKRIQSSTEPLYFWSGFFFSLSHEQQYKDVVPVLTLYMQKERPTTYILNESSPWKAKWNNWWMSFYLKKKHHYNLITTRSQQ